METVKFMDHDETYVIRKLSPTTIPKNKNKNCATPYKNKLCSDWRLKMLMRSMLLER